MIEALPNVISNEEISFKLTQNLIPSVANSTSFIIPTQGSLQFSQSRISIQQMLHENQSQKWMQNMRGMSISKNSSLKASSINTTNASTIKNTPRTSFRERTISNIKIETKPNFKRRLSFYNIQFNPKGHVSNRSQKRQRCVSETKPKSKFISYRQKQDEKKYSGIDCINQILQIKQIRLGNDEQKQRKYSNHMGFAKICWRNLGEISKSIPLWSGRKHLIKF